MKRCKFQYDAAISGNKSKSKLKNNVDAVLCEFLLSRTVHFMFRFKPNSYAILS